MKSQGDHPQRTSDLAAVRLAWLVTLVAGGLVLVAGALAFDLHNQKRRLENFSAGLKETNALREAESKNLGARSRTGESVLQRLNESHSEGESDLKRLGEVFTQREPLVKQATEVQGKIQALASDLLELAKTDPDARAIARKYNIQQNPAPPSAGAAKP